MTDLPFADATFQVAFSQHVQMNVADKPRSTERRAGYWPDGGRLAMWDIVSATAAIPIIRCPGPTGPNSRIWPLPTELRAVVESAGFAVEHWNDLTDQAASTMQMFLGLPPNPLGLHAFVPDFAEKAQNLTEALTDGRLRAIQAVARAVTR